MRIIRLQIKKADFLILKIHLKIIIEVKVMT